MSGWRVALLVWAWATSVGTLLTEMVFGYWLFAASCVLPAAVMTALFWLYLTAERREQRTSP